MGIGYAITADLPASASTTKKLSNLMKDLVE